MLENYQVQSGGNMYLIVLIFLLTAKMLSLAPNTVGFPWSDRPTLCIFQKVSTKYAVEISLPIVFLIKILWYIRKVELTTQSHDPLTILMIL